MSHRALLLAPDMLNEESLGSPITYSNPFPSTVGSIGTSCWRIASFPNALVILASSRLPFFGRVASQDTLRDEVCYQLGESIVESQMACRNVIRYVLTDEGHICAVIHQSRDTLSGTSGSGCPHNSVASPCCCCDGCIHNQSQQCLLFIGRSHGYLA